MIRTYSDFVEKIVQGRDATVFFGQKIRLQTGKRKEQLCKDKEISLDVTVDVPKRKLLSNIRNRQALLALLKSKLLSIKNCNVVLSEKSRLVDSIILAKTLVNLGK